MPTTSNFGWTTPADTDLVKDGAAAIRTLGNGIDTSFLDLKGGTTDQVLAKNSNTDLDFKWVSDATGIQATIFDAKGDLIAASAADTAARLAVGTNGTVLTADSTTATGLKWATPAASKTYSLLNAGGTTLSGSGTVTISSLTGYDDLLLLIEMASSGSASAGIRFRVNTDSTSKYSFFGISGSTLPDNTYSGLDGGTSIPIAFMGNNQASTVSGYVRIFGCNSTGIKTTLSSGAGDKNGGATNNTATVFGGAYSGTSVVSSISLFSDTGNFDSGKIYLFGAI